MFENIEIRKAANGFIMVVVTEDDTTEFVYDSSRKLMRTLKQFVESNSKESSED